MNCEDIQKELPAYISGEVESSVRVEIRDHLESCPDCARVFQETSRLSEVLQSWKGVEPPPMMYEKLKRRIGNPHPGWRASLDVSFVKKAAFRLAEIAAVAALTLVVSQWFYKPALKEDAGPASINFYLTEHREAVARTVPAELSTAPASRIPVDRDDLLYYEFVDRYSDTPRPGVILRGRAAREAVQPEPSPPPSSDERVLPLEQARKTVDFPLVAPVRLHPGYILDSVRKIADRNCLHLLYTNGVDTLSLFEQPADGERGLAASDFRRYAVYRNEEPAPEQARVTILAWSSRKIALVLIGRPDLSQLMDIGRRINEAAEKGQTAAPNRPSKS